VKLLKWIIQDTLPKGMYIPEALEKLFDWIEFTPMLGVPKR
jgi:hypothetical protein